MNSNSSSPSSGVPSVAELDPTIEVRPAARFVDCDDTFTSAGVERAQQVRRGIQYDLEPPISL